MERIMLIKKIIIVNSVEIVAGGIEIYKKMNIKTVAVYSEADAYLSYVGMADESYLLGPALVNESYMKADKIIETAKECGADAIHPGYGFLSENSSFVKKCEDAGLI